MRLKGGENPANVRAGAEVNFKLVVNDYINPMLSDKLPKSNPTKKQETKVRSPLL